MEFYRNRRKTVNIILACTGLLAVLILLFLYGVGIFNDIIRPKVAAFSGGLGLVLAFVVVKTLLSSNDTSALVILNKDGIITKVTAVSKAAGLIRWDDIKDMSLNKVGGDQLVTLSVSNSGHYMPIIRKKLSALVTNGLEDPHGNLQINLTASELDIEAPELFKLISDYKATISKQPE